MAISFDIYLKPYIYDYQNGDANPGTAFLDYDTSGLSSKLYRVQNTFPYMDPQEEIFEFKPTAIIPPEVTDYPCMLKNNLFDIHDMALYTDNFIKLNYFPYNTQFTGVTVTNADISKTTYDAHQIIGRKGWSFDTRNQTWYMFYITDSASYGAEGTVNYNLRNSTCMTYETVSVIGMTEQIESENGLFRVDFSAKDSSYNDYWVNRAYATNFGTVIESVDIVFGQTHYALFHYSGSLLLGAFPVGEEFDNTLTIEELALINWDFVGYVYSNGYQLQTGETFNSSVNFIFSGTAGTDAAIKRYVKAVSLTSASHTVRALMDSVKGHFYVRDYEAHPTMWVKEGNTYSDMTIDSLEITLAEYNDFQVNPQNYTYDRVIMQEDDESVLIGYFGQTDVYTDTIAVPPVFYQDGDARPATDIKLNDNFFDGSYFYAFTSPFIFCPIGEDMYQTSYNDILAVQEGVFWNRVSKFHEIIFIEEPKTFISTTVYQTNEEACDGMIDNFLLKQADKTDTTTYFVLDNTALTKNLTLNDAYLTFEGLSYD